MTDLVPHDQIEAIVRAKRHPTLHQARADSRTKTVYVLHSHECLDSGRDLRECPFSLALDNGIRLEEWQHDVPLVVDVNLADEKPRLVPRPQCT